MEYYFSKTISLSFDEAITRVTDVLKSEGFGIITEIRMHEKLKEKLGVDFKKYTILGACNPAYASFVLRMLLVLLTISPIALLSFWFVAL